jgi:PAS domain-containing protein
VHLDDYGVAFNKYYSVKAWKIPNNLVGIAITDISEKRRTKIEKAEIKLTLENLKKDTEETQKLANIGSWIFNSETQIPQWSDEMFNIWAFDSEQGVPDYKTIVKRIHPEDCQLYNSAVNNAINQGTPFNIEFRIQIPNRDQKIINGICKPILGGDAKSIIIQGINQDITKQKLFENDLVEHERLKAIGEMSASIAHDFNN